MLHLEGFDKQVRFTNFAAYIAALVLGAVFGAVLCITAEHPQWALILPRRLCPLRVPRAFFTAAFSGYCWLPLKMVLGLSVGMVLAGAVIVMEESLNLLRSTIVSERSVTADGILLLVVPGVAKLRVSRFRFNFISTRWRYEVDSSIQKSSVAWKFLVLFMNCLN